MHPESKVDKFLAPKSFGRGTFLGDNPSILDLTPRKQVKVLAWRHACPRQKAVIKYYGETWLKTQASPANIPAKEVWQHGIEMTLQRYGECNFVFGLIIEHIKRAGKKKSNLLRNLTSPTPRLPEESVGQYERGTVPKSHKREMSPLSTLVGYALPRVFIEQAGRGKEKRSWRYSLAIDLLDKAIEKSRTPTELLAIFAKLATQADANPTIVLSHALEPGISKEENNRTEYGVISNALGRYAPQLWAHYQKLSEVERENAGIIKSIPGKAATSCASRLSVSTP